MNDYDNETVLHDAAWGGNVKLFEFLVEGGLDVNSSRNDGKTVLHQCCMSGKIDMCKYLVAYHEELLNVTDMFGYSALHDAAWGGNTELFAFLLEKGLDINCKANNGKTVLHACCMNGKVDMCKSLVKKNNDLLSVKDNNGYTVLHDAAKSNSKELLEYLLSKGLQVNELTQLGKTLLHVACMENNVFMVDYLAVRYPQLLEVVDYSSNNALHDAAWGGMVELLEYLVSRGLDVNATRKDGKTILHMCCMNGKLKMTAHIIDNYPSLLFVRDQDGYTALHDSVKGRNVELLSYLLSKGLRATDKTFMDQTILHVACMRGQYHICKHLVDNFPILLNENDKFGHTVLHATAWGGNVDLLMLLLVHGIEINCKRNDGKTVLHMSCMNGKINMCRYLLYYYPRLRHIMDMNGEDALKYATSLGNRNLVDILSDQ
jgi:serine/threonine-protein phosphatase 6 regulatory ankyrin repeat subunit B